VARCEFACAGIATNSLASSLRVLDTSSWHGFHQFSKIPKAKLLWHPLRAREDQIWLCFVRFDDAGAELPHGYLSFRY
jgi:hypothetical protein